MGALATQGDLDGLVMRQEGALQSCDGRGDTLVELIDLHNAQYQSKKWWIFW